MDRRQLVASGVAFGLISPSPFNAAVAHGVTKPQQVITSSKAAGPNSIPAFWNNQHEYDLRLDRLASSGGKETKRIRVSGDYLSISHIDMASLERTPDGPASNVDRLVFDGREVHLETTLALSQGKVEIYADQLFLNEGGSVSLFGDRKTDNSALIIVCHELILPDTSFEKPINIYFDGKGGGPSVRIYCDKVSLSGMPVTSSPELAVWNAVGASDESDTPPAGTVEIIVGDQASITAADIWSKEVRWPAEVYAKALRIHASNPFDVDTVTAIAHVAARVDTVIGRTSLPQVAKGFPALVASASNGIDTFGHRASWAPRKSLTNQRDDLKKAIYTFGSGLSDDLIMMMAAAYADTIVPPDQLSSLQQQKAQLDAQASDIDAQIAANIEISKQLKIDFDSLKDSIANAQDRIAHEAADDAKRAQDAATARQGFVIVGTVAGVATSFYCGPAAGAAVAAGIQTVGNLVYASNTTGVNLKSLGDIVQQGTGFYQQMTDVFSTWDTVSQKKALYLKVHKGDVVLKGDPPPAGQPDNRKPYTEAQAAQEAGSALGAFGKAFGTVISGLKAEVPEPIKLSDKENKDPELQELLERLSTNQRKQSEALGALQTLIEKKTSTVSAIEQMRDALEKLLTISAVNDLEKAEWADRARYIWLSQIQSLVGQIYILERAFFFETGQNILLRSDLLNFPASLIALQESSAVDVLAPGTAVTSVDVRQYLTGQRAQITAAGEIILTAVNSGIDDYLSRHQPKNSFQQAVEFRVDDKDANKRAFVAAINAQIKILIARRKGGYALTASLDNAPVMTGADGSPAAADAKRAVPLLLPLYIPFLLPAPANIVQAPQRFMQARVIEVQWRDPATHLGDDGMNITIVHPGYGEVVGNGGRRFFDLREGDSQNEIRFPTSSYMLARHMGIRSSNIPNELGANYYTYFPARTDYYLEIEITSDNWARPPEVQEIVIGWEFFQ